MPSQPVQLYQGEQGTETKQKNTQREWKPEKSDMHPVSFLQ